MRFDDYAEHVTDFTSEMTEVTGKKNPDYSVGDDDAMGNFKIIGEDADVEPLTAWAVLFFKHVTAIMSYVRKGKLMDESIHSRFIDLANYCMLGDALVKDLANEDREEMIREAAEELDAMAPTPNRSTEDDTDLMGRARKLLDELQKATQPSPSKNGRCDQATGCRVEMEVPSAVKEWMVENNVIGITTLKCKS